MFKFHKVTLRAFSKWYVFRNIRFWWWNFTFLLPILSLLWVVSVLGAHGSLAMTWYFVIVTLKRIKFRDINCAFTNKYRDFKRLLWIQSWIKIFLACVKTGLRKLSVWCCVTCASLKCLIIMWKVIVRKWTPPVFWRIFLFLQLYDL